jgi:hypothetical protein
MLDQNDDSKGVRDQRSLLVDRNSPVGTGEGEEDVEFEAAADESELLETQTMRLVWVEVNPPRVKEVAVASTAPPSRSTKKRGSVTRDSVAECDENETSSVEGAMSTDEQVTKKGKSGGKGEKRQSDIELPELDDIVIEIRDNCSLLEAFSAITTHEAMHTLIRDGTSLELAVGTIKKCFATFESALLSISARVERGLYFSFSLSYFLKFSF